MFQSIELENLLSFKHVELELKPLNVLIGANASGKSNLIRAFGLLRALPKDMSAEIAEGGGVREWINQKTKGTARIALVRDLNAAPYEISFRETASILRNHRRKVWGASVTRADSLQTDDSREVDLVGRDGPLRSRRGRGRRCL